MSPLIELHRRLASLRRRRFWLRAGSALSVLLLVVLWSLVGLFVLDWTMRLSVGPRLVALLVVAAAWAAVAWWLIRPWWRQRETAIDLALFVQRQNKIDTDLVAALEFDAAQRGSGDPRWGSPTLQQAVIDHAARLGQDLDVYQGLTYRPLAVRAGILGASLLVIGILAAVFAPYAQAFFRRLALNDVPYPTHTQIVRLVINGQELPVYSSQAVVIRCPEGRPVEIVAHCTGDLPPSGRIELWEAGGQNHSFESLRADNESQDMRQYRASIPRLLRNVGFQVHLGDAWTSPGELHVVALPRVEVTLHTRPPDYLAGRIPTTEGEPGAMQAVVVDGSRVIVHLTSTKPLKPEGGAVLTTGGRTFALRRIGPAEKANAGANDSGEQWELDDDASPLANVKDTIAFDIQVTDQDGLQLPSPIQGYIRRKADRPPKASLQVTTRNVLPSAQPSVLFGALDDYGLAELRLEVSRTGSDGKQQVLATHTLPVPQRSQRLEPLLFSAPAEMATALDEGRLPPEIAGPLREAGLPDGIALRVEVVRPGEVWNLMSSKDAWHFAIKREKKRGTLQVFRQFVLDLAPLNASPGQELTVAVRAIDYRGAQPGEATLSEPVLISVTGEAAVLADISEPDTRSLETLNRIIQRQLGIGETP